MSKLAHSYFLITINTNVPYDNAPQDLIPNFQKAVKEIFYTDEGFADIIDDLNNKEGVDPKLIKSIQCSYCIEKGDQQQRIHSHIYYQIDHRTKLHINKNRLTKSINEKLKIDSCYINIKIVRYVKDDKSSIIEYMSKSHN
jgi:hypothetical protein